MRAGYRSVTERAAPKRGQRRYQGVTPEERRRLLGDDVIAHIRARVAEAPEPPDEVVDALRRILTRPAGWPPSTLTRPNRTSTPPQTREPTSA